MKKLIIALVVGILAMSVLAVSGVRFGRSLNENLEHGDARSAAESMQEELLSYFPEDLVLSNERRDRGWASCKEFDMFFPRDDGIDGYQWEEETVLEIPARSDPWDVAEQIAADYEKAGEYTVKRFRDGSPVLVLEGPHESGGAIWFFEPFDGRMWVETKSQCVRVPSEER